MERHHASRLLILRLDNFAAINAAFGEAVAMAAMEHLRCAAGRILGRIDVRPMEQNELELLVHHPAMPSHLLGAALESEPFQRGEAAILLSISVIHADDPGIRPELEARARLAASACSAAPDEWAKRYRKDMKLAVELIRMMQRRATFLTWRSVTRSDDHDHVLYHEGTMRRLADQGEQLDCADGYAALERLELAHLADRVMLFDTVDELERDPTACLSVPVSTRSLSLNPHGAHCGWDEIIARLKRNRTLARRLVIEIADNSPIACLRGTVSLVRLLRDLGVRFSVARFGSGQASINELVTIAPDVVKLDSSFLHTAYQSDRNRVRLGRLLELARTVSPTVIVDGVESPWHLHLAMEEGADWVAGSHLGRPGRRREPSNARRADDGIALLTLFNSTHPTSPNEVRNLAC